jgi:hypothetical protein
MRRSTNNSLYDDSHLPSLDDDLDTLLKKAEAIFKQKKVANHTPPAQPTPAPRPPEPTPAPSLPTQERSGGLMQRRRRP